MSELQTQKIDQLTTEILIYKQQTAQNIIEIGKRLIEVKASLAHGEWGKWLEEKVDFRNETASRFMKVARECANLTSISNMGTGKIFALLDIPQEEREAFIAETDIDSMTTRQLQQAIKAKKQAEQELTKAKEESWQEKTKNLELRTKLEQLANAKPQIKEVIKEVIPEDYEQLQESLKEKELQLSQIKKEDSEYNSKKKKLLEEIAELENKSDEFNKRYNQNTQMAKISVKMRGATSKVRENAEDIKMLIKQSDYMMDNHTRIECLYMIESLETFCNDIRNLLAERADIIDY